jgi:hypothetical protein
VIRVNVFVTSLSGERLWDVERLLPAQVQIAVNINLLGLEQRGDGSLDAPFVLTVNFVPPVAQISVKGKAKVTGEKAEVERIIEDHKQQKTPPTVLIQAVSSAAIADAVLVSKSLGVPPPLPPIAPPQPQISGKSEQRYTL